MLKLQIHDPVHFIGIGGCGMSGIAYILLKRGFKVQGSDIEENSATKRLKSLGAKIYLFHNPSNIEGAKEVIYSSAISEDNSELLAARKKKLPLFSRGKMLGRLMDKTLNITVCGSHGKTSTTSLISFFFFKVGLDPTFVVGGEMINFGNNAYAGRGDFFIAEADESDGSFLMLSPSFEVITNIEEEHMNYYKTFANLKEAFFLYIEHIKDSGWLLAGGDDGGVMNILLGYRNRIKVPIITYGLDSSNTIYAYNICRRNNRTSFNVTFGTKELGRAELSIPGLHNVNNTLPAIALGLLHDVQWKRITEILPEFKGVERRFQVKGRYKGALIIDDYAHHPTEIRTTLKVAKECRYRRIIAIFQPHRYTRTRDLAYQFALSLNAVDLAILLPIYPASEKPIPGVTSELICKHMKKLGSSSLYFEDQEEVLKYLRKIVEPDDIVLTLGAGDVYKIGDRLILES